MSQNANEMMSLFCIIVEQAFNVHAPLKSSSLRYNKPKIFLDRNKFLTGKKNQIRKLGFLVKDFIALNTEKNLMEIYTRS